MLGARLSNADIAGRLHISVRTVENHVSSLLRKYGVADRRALGELAVQVQAGAPLPGRLAGLPSALTTFIGRSAEREHLMETLRAARLVTVVGPGGMGKTRLAGQIAGAAGPSFPAGGAFVDLVPARGGYVAQAVASALGVSERPQQSLEDAVVERLGESRSLLVLDNCEHVIDVVAPFAERVLAACPGTHILATSRERLGVRGERAVPLGPLPLESDAERLFIDRATAANSVHRWGGAARWRLLQTVRAFAIEQLDVSGERPEIQDRHLRWAAEVASELETRLDGDEWYDEFDGVADDLRAALAVTPQRPG